MGGEKRPGLWTRIREARLFRVLLLYVGASWIILQATAILRNEFQLPQWVAGFWPSRAAHSTVQQP